MFPTITVTLDIHKIKRAGAATRRAFAAVNSITASLFEEVRGRSGIRDAASFKGAAFFLRTGSDPQALSRLPPLLMRKFPFTLERKTRLRALARV